MEESKNMRQDILNRLDSLNNSAESNINSEMDKEKNILVDTKLTVHDASLKSWAMTLMKEQHSEWSNLFEAKMAEHENKVRKELEEQNTFSSGRSPKKSLLMDGPSDEAL